MSRFPWHILKTWHSNNKPEPVWIQGGKTKRTGHDLMKPISHLPDSPRLVSIPLGFAQERWGFSTQVIHNTEEGTKWRAFSQFHSKIEFRGNRGSPVRFILSSVFPHHCLTQMYLLFVSFVIFFFRYWRILYLNSEIKL